MPDASLPGELLQELPEAQATGELRRIYAEIRQLSGVPMVALIYRHLATIPGALEWAWGLLQPAMRAGAVQQRAWQLAQAAGIERQPALPRAALRAAGLDEADQRQIAQVLDAYNRANPVNIMAVRCLWLHLARMTQAATVEDWPQWTPPAPIPALPAMVDLAAMTPTVRELALLLGNRGRAGPPSPLWPSLYRHLAHWPAFLGYACVLVPPEFAAIDAAASRLRGAIDAAAAEIAGRLAPPPDRPAPSGAQADRLRSAIEQFTVRIPEMVVIGNVLRRALPAEA
jgi:hypothetical protein